MPTDKPTSGKMEDEKIWAVLSYVWIISILVLLLKKDVPYAFYHAKQGLALFLLETVGAFILGFIPVIGWILLPFFWIGIIILLIIGVVNALQGKKAPLPLIGTYAEELKI